MAATGSPRMFVQAGELGMPLALGVIGGTLARLRPFVDLYREAGRRAGHAPERLKLSVHAIGFVGATSADARSAFFPGYHAIFGELATRHGRLAFSKNDFDAMCSPGEALFVGDESEVTEKLRSLDRELGGVSRVCLQMTVGPLRRDNRLRTIEPLAQIQRKLAL